MIRYKTNICVLLKEEAGYSSYRLKKEKKMSSATWYKLSKGEPVSLKVIENLCHLLHKQPGDLIEFVNR